MTETSFVGTNSSIGMLSESDAETDYDNRKSPDYLSSQDSEYIKHVTPEDSYQSQPVLIQLFFGVLQVGCLFVIHRMFSSNFCYFALLK